MRATFRGGEPVSDHELTSWLARWGRRLLPGRQARLIDDAVAAAAPGQTRLADIQHVVILMQENRSFDHYFGTMSAVRGFSDPDAATQEAGILPIDFLHVDIVPLKRGWMRRPAAAGPGPARCTAAPERG
jgi:phospholipase C